MTARSIALALAAAIALLGFRAAPARADADKDASERAQAHFRQGQAFFQIEQYDRALAEYQASFDLSAKPSLIFNIALCHDRANRPEQALQAFRRYLALAPGGDVADEAREDVARLTLVVEKLEAQHEAGRAAEQAQRREEAARRETAARLAAGDRRRRIARTLVVSGAVVALAGAASHALAWRTRERLADPFDLESYVADRDTFRLQRNIAIGAYTAGAITIATGLILGRTVRRSDGPQVSAAVSPDGAAVAVRWSR